MLPADASDACRNCGIPLTGPYCAQCGQHANECIVPFRTFAVQHLRDFFSLDSRFLHTLGVLFRRPGYLTNEYVVLKVLYIRHRILYARHFVFSLHVHAFAFLVLLVLFLLDAVGVPMQLKPGDGGELDLISLCFFAIFWIYLFLALRRVYDQSRSKTFFKLMLLMIVYLNLFGVAFAVVALISLLLF